MRFVKGDKSEREFRGWGSNAPRVGSDIKVRERVWKGGERNGEKRASLVGVAWHDRAKRRKGKMLTIQRSESLRGTEGCSPRGTHLLPPVGSGASVSGWKPAERSVSFNRDVHVKRIGESRQYHTHHTNYTDISCICSGAREIERNGAAWFFGLDVCRLF